METPESSSSPEPKTNRARERHLRRKERQQAMAQPSGAPRQLKPSGGFEMPRIQLPGNRLILYGAAAAIFLVAVVFLIGALNPPDTQAGPNAIWIGTQWTYDYPGDDALRAFVQKLRDHRIGTVYAWVSLLQPNNAWSDTTRLNQIRTFITQFKAAYPDASLYGWLSIDALGTDGSSRLGDTNVQQIIADFSQRMTSEFQFDGVVLNVVPALDGDENYLSLLRQVRSSIGEGSLLAAAVPPDWTPANVGIPVPPRIAPGTVWEETYKQRVALIADEMIVTAYNSGFSTAEDYSAWMAYQVRAFSSAIATLDSSTRLLIGLPAYDSQLPTHDSTVENIDTATTGIRDGIDQAGDAGAIVRGTAVYAEWQMTDEDWARFRAAWASG
jgi:hypothetical protein